MTSRSRRVLIAVWVRRLGSASAVMLAISIAPAMGLAQSFVFPGGGGTAGAAGQPTVVATIGQPAIGLAAAGAAPSLTVHAGFVAGLTAGSMSGTLPPVVADAAHAATVAVTLAGFSVPPTVTLRFRMGGEQSFTAIPMTRPDIDVPTWTGSIPADQVTIRGVQFYVEADDGISRVTLPAGAPTTVSDLEVRLTNQALFSTSNAFALRGVSMVASNPAATSVFDELGGYDTTAWRYGTYDPGTQAYLEPPSAAPAAPGRGFWIISRSTRSIAASGRSTRLDQPVAVTLQPGWNQIANPFAFSVSFADLTLPAGTDDNLVGWDGAGYVNGRLLLEASVGYWLHYGGTAAGSLLIPPRGAVTKASPTSEPPPYLVNDGSGWCVVAAAQAGAFADTDNRFGLSPAATAERDAIDYMDAPPPPAGYVTLCFLTGAGERLLNDFRGDESSGESWLLSLDTDQAREPFRVSFAAERALPPDWRLLAIDLSTLEEIDLLVSGEITGRVGDNGASRRWRLAAGPDAFVTEIRNDVVEEFNQTVVAFALRPASPNPFVAANGTVITLAAPREEGAALRVYDLRGRVVKTLHAGPIGRGLSRFAWHGEDDANQRVAAGLYLVRLRAADVELVQKVLLVH